MKFRCDRDSLAAAVSTAARAVASRAGALPVLSGLRVTLSPGKVEFTGSDLELTIRAQTVAEVDGTGSVVLVARLLVDTLAKITADNGNNNGNVNGVKFTQKLFLTVLPTF